MTYHESKCCSRPSRGLHGLTPKHQQQELPPPLKVPVPWLHGIEFNNNDANAQL